MLSAHLTSSPESCTFPFGMDHCRSKHNPVKCESTTGAFRSVWVCSLFALLHWDTLYLALLPVQGMFHMAPPVNHSNSKHGAVVEA